MSPKLKKFSSDTPDLQLGHMYPQETPEVYFFMGPHLALGALNPYFPRYTIAVCVHGNQTKCFPTIFV
jgi:hypothetical protein